ncbi:MAG: aminotransferase class V-fold PLP-dependent enzyme [Candidatus Aerophobetes bacterium]|nr:aminotransferase class V-fold PLP-dependent enzyme [Candidatus Aerophobetes bacterium]
MNIKKVYEDTPLKEGYIYLDHGGGSISPRQVSESICQFIDKMSRIGPIEPQFYQECRKIVKETKQELADFIGAKTGDEIAFTKNGSEAINIIINGIPWKAGEEVIVSSIETTSGFVPLLRLSRTRGVKVKVAKNNGKGIVEINEIRKLITDKTRLISLIHLSNVIGTLQPVEDVGKICKKHNILFLVNASQSIGQVPVDVSRLNCDFLVAPCRKWLRGPAGLGFLYCRSKLINELEPSFIGWNSTTWLSEKEYCYANTAERFEAGEYDYPVIVGLRSAIDYIREVGGINEIRNRVEDLTTYLIENLKKIKGIEIYGTLDARLRGGIVSFNIEHMKSEVVGSLMSRNSIILEVGNFAAPLALKTFDTGVCVRVCVHYFNTYEEIDRFISVLERK